MFTHPACSTRQPTTVSVPFSFLQFPVQCCVEFFDAADSWKPAGNCVFVPQLMASSATFSIKSLSISICATRYYSSLPPNIVAPNFTSIMKKIRCLKVSPYHHCNSTINYSVRVGKFLSLVTLHFHVVKVM